MSKRFQYCLIALLACFLCAHADDGYNPPSPPEPFVNYSVVVTASPAVAGTVSGTGKYSAGQNVNISASPKSNYTFSHWTINNYYYGNAKNFTYVVGDSVASFVAHFLSQQKVTVAVSPVGGGTVSGAGSFTEGTAITLSVTPKTDYTFLHWTINGFFFSDQQSATYVVGDSAANFVAVLQKNEGPNPDPYNPALPPEPEQRFRLTLQCSPEGVATLTGGGEYRYGQNATIKATYSSSNNVFDGWTIDGVSCSSTVSFTYSMPDSSVTMVAHFKSKWAVTTSVEPTQAGKASGAGTYMEGTNVTISVSVKEGYNFLHWTLNGVVFSEELSFAYQVGDSTAAFVAVFDEYHNPEPYNPDLPPEPMGKVSIYAETPAGYYFVKWNDGVTDNPRLVNSGTESNYTPVFELITFDINTTAEMCQGEVYLLGDKRLTTSGVYKAMLKSQLGADSLVTLNLTVHPSYHIKNTVTIAEDGSYDFFGETLTDEGTYIKEFTTTKGCDSIFIVTIRKGTEIPEPEQTYSISFLNYDGTELQSDELEYGQTPSYQGETPVKPADAQYTYTFSGWTPEIVAVTEDATYTATYSATEIIVEPPVNDTIIVPHNGNVNISTLGVSGESVIIVQPGGQLTVDENANINVLIVTSNGVQSGQVHDCDNLTAQRIYLEYVLNPDPNNDVASPNLWYAIAVPFQVDIKTGITRAHGKKSHVSGVDFLILEYDGMKRANTGKGWVKKISGSLIPGTFYMFGIEGNCNRWLFEKTSGSPIQGENQVDLYKYFAGNSANGKHNGWNGMGNTKLEYMDVDFSGCEINYVIMYDNLISDYVTYPLSSSGELCVGQPFFVQAPNKDNMYVNFGKVTQDMPALRARNAVEPFMTFTLTEGDNQHTHYPMYLTMHEDAETTYSIGRDIMRMDGGGNRVAKFWMISQDSTELSAHGIAIPETETVIPIGIFAPKDGEYLLNMSERATDDFEVELLYQGAYAATLFADQPLVLNLNAGTTTDYSLRIRRKAPQGLDDVHGDDVHGTKVLINGHMYILQGSHIFDAQGKQVK